MTTPEPLHFLFALTDGGGTVPPEVGVVRRLVDRGHRVRVLAEPSMAEEVRAVGAELLLWQHTGRGPGAAPSHTAFRDWEMRTPFSLARGMAEHMIAGPAPGQAQDALAAIREDHPDLILTSFLAFGAMIGAEAAGVPFDVLVPNIYPLPAPPRPPFGLGLKPARTFFGRFRDRVVGAVSTRVLSAFTLPRLNAVRTELGLPSLGEHWDQVRAARRQLVLSSEVFDFPAPLTDSVRFIGPILDDPAWAADGDWDAPPGPEPLVLVAMSSTFQGHRKTLQNIVDALASLPVRGLVTTGPALNPQELRGSDNVLIVTSVPHHEVLPEADLVITHGGHGTVMKALLAGLPMVVLPHGRDQGDNAVRISAHGAGRTVPKRASSRRIARAAGTVLINADYTEAARRLGAQIRADIDNSPLLSELEALG